MKKITQIPEDKMSNQYQLSFDDKGTVIVESNTRKNSDAAMVSGSKAMQMLDLSRHALKKSYKKALLLRYYTAQRSHMTSMR